MSQYYNPKRTRNLFDPNDTKPFTISRSKIDLFLECPRCFYLDRRLGVARPPGYPFTLNAAVDRLLKKEFDIHRANGTAHPLMKQYGVEAIPFRHEDLELWRDTFKGVRFWHRPTNLTISGAIDDIWVNPKGELMVVDYKATAKEGEVDIDADWQEAYKRQMEVYQWLLRQNGHNVSDTGYFVYCNASTDKKAFDGELEFKVKILPYTGKDTWIEKTIKDIHECLMSDEIPPSGKECDWCPYRETAVKELQEKWRQKFKNNS